MRKFGEQAALFRNCHSAAPTCSPSRAALLTGETAHQSGVLGLVHRGWDLYDRSRHLARFLGENGFHTVLSGIQHEFDLDRGASPYDEHLESNGSNFERDVSAGFGRKRREEKYSVGLGGMGERAPPCGRRISRGLEITSRFEEKSFS